MSSQHFEQGQQPALNRPIQSAPRRDDRWWNVVPVGATLVEINRTRGVAVFDWYDEAGELLRWSVSLASGRCLL